jgi:hypothetical protein
MKRLPLLALLALVVTVAIRAAEFRYGSSSDLAGAKTFFVDSGSLLEAHADLTARVHERIGWDAVDEPDKADVTVLWDEDGGGKCGAASVLRNIDGEKPKLAFQWKDCGSHLHFLFVRRLDRAIPHKH